MIDLKLHISFSFVLSAFLPTTLVHSTYHPSWTTLAPLPQPRQEHTTVFLPPSTISVLGGIIPTNKTGPIPIITTPHMKFYSLSNNTWTDAPPLFRAMNLLDVDVVDGQIYVLVGNADLGEPAPSWRAVRDAFSDSPRTGTWTKLSDVPLGE